MVRNDFIIDNSDFKNKVKNIQKQYPNFADFFLKKMAMLLIRKVRFHTPVDTGLLRKSWFAKKPVITNTSTSVTVYNNVKYAAKVEYGSYKSKYHGIRSGRFMLKKSMSEMEDILPKALDVEIQNFINKQGLGR